MKKIPKQAYTVEFKEQDVKRVVAEGQAIPATASELGLSDQTLRNWVSRLPRASSRERTARWYRRI